ncbi:unnamed protein product [Blepharisma stoltei]|uniref:Uncharacterized protein n=1 Tax=Blepharisma stoltei TaxID=1481888 RepID=A0AAU9J1D1_9CILI|nr:unnamed protein product [Blepharisma stoltei]
MPEQKWFFEIILFVFLLMYLDQFLYIFNKYMLPSCIILFFITSTLGLEISWIPKTRSPPSSRHYSTMDYFPSNNSLVIFGGYDTDSMTSYNDLWMFSFTSNTWQRLSTTANVLPGDFYIDQRYSSASFADDTKSIFYIFGGRTSNGPQNDLWAFSMKYFMVLFM